MTVADPVVPPGLVASGGRLDSRHDLLLVDLDGVIYLGEDPIPGAAEALGEARRAGLRVIFVTNNASRPPEAVAEKLTGLGVSAQPGEVMTSAVAAAEVLAGDLAPGAAVLAVGGPGVADALSAAGLRAVSSAEDRPAAVLQGFGADVGWRVLAEASIALRAGARWVATNDDKTLPSPRGPLPGNGSLVAALQTATGLRPQVIGKPAPALFGAALRAGGGKRPLVIGDRLDTDIAGARVAGLPSLLVLSGVATPKDLLGADPASRPNYLGRDLRALGLGHPGVRVEGGVAFCGRARAHGSAGQPAIDNAADSAAATSPDGLDGLRALCALAWSEAGDDRLPDDRISKYDEALHGLGLD